MIETQLFAFLFFRKGEEIRWKADFYLNLGFDAVAL